MLYSDDIKEQIREKIDIVDLVGKYLPLQRQGRLFVARCPWHDDRKPSLQVNPERQSFKCWVCDIGGDIFSFVMKMEGCEFPEAKRILAEMAGIELPEYHKSSGGFSHRHFDPSEAPEEADAYEPSPEELNGPLLSSKPTSADNDSSNSPNVSSDNAPLTESPLPLEPSSENTQNPLVTRNSQPATNKSTPRQTLFKVLSWVEKQYHESLLYDPMGERARNYLRNRGITDESIEKFQLGYCPEPPNWLVGKVNNVPRRIRLLTEAGILSSGNYGGMYDRFRDRVMFPIHNAMGQCIAFGGRMMDDTTVVSKAKYINSPETALFSKRKQLYGLDIAKTSMTRSRRALVVEGYMDCIVCHQFGFTDTVAVLGTALGSKHIETLRHYVDKVILMLDGDAAGQKRTSEVLELFISQNMDLQVVTLPQEQAPDGSIPKDPAEYLLAWGKDTLEELIQTKGKSALDHAVDFYTRGVDLHNDIHGAQQALDRIMELMAKIPLEPQARGADPQFREHQILLNLAVRFRMEPADVIARLKSFRQKLKANPRRNWDDYDDESDETEQTTQEQNIEAVLNGEYPSEWGTQTPYERELFELLLNNPQLWPNVHQSVMAEDLRFAPARQAYQLIQLWTDQGNEFSVQFLLDNLADPRMKAWVIQRLDAGSRNPVANANESLNELLVNFRNYRIDRQKPEILEKIQESDPGQAEIPWSQILHNLRTRHGISDSTDGTDRGDDPENNPPF